MCVQPVPTHPDRVHRPVLTKHGLCCRAPARHCSRTVRPSVFSGKVRADIPIFQNLPRHLPVLVHTGKVRAAFLRKGPCGHSNIPKSPQIVTSTGVYRKKHAAFLLKGPCGHSNIPKSPQMITSTGAYRKTACRISPEGSVRTFQYSKISPDSYQYWRRQEITHSSDA